MSGITTRIINSNARRETPPFDPIREPPEKRGTAPYFLASAGKKQGAVRGFRREIGGCPGFPVWFPYIGNWWLSLITGAGGVEAAEAVAGGGVGTAAGEGGGRRVAEAQRPGGEEDRVESVHPAAVVEVGRGGAGKGLRPEESNW